MRVSENRLPRPGDIKGLQNRNSLSDLFDIFSNSEYIPLPTLKTPHDFCWQSVFVKLLFCRISILIFGQSLCKYDGLGQPTEILCLVLKSVKGMEGMSIFGALWQSSDGGFFIDTLVNTGSTIHSGNPGGHLYVLIFLVTFGANPTYKLAINGQK